MVLSGEVKDMFVNVSVHQLATSTRDGIPNICNVGAKYIRDDGKIVVIDNFMLKTLANVLDNPAVSILMRKGLDSYQIKGTCAYVSEGDEYAEAHQWMKSIDDNFPAKGALIITVEDVYYAVGGGNAGKRVA